MCGHAEASTGFWGTKIGWDETVDGGRYFELSARLRGAYPQPEPDIPQPCKGLYLLMFKVHGKFYGKELRPFGNLAPKALAPRGYSNNDVGESMKGENQTLPKGLFC